MPGLAGESPQKSQLIRCQSWFWRLNGLADSPGDPRRDQPQAKKREGSEQRPRVRRRHERRCCQRPKGRDPHGFVKTEQVCFSFRVARRTPFQEPFSRCQHAQQRPSDGVQADVSIVRKKREVDEDLGRIAGQRTPQLPASASAKANQPVCARGPPGPRAIPEWK